MDRADCILVTGVILSMPLFLMAACAKAPEPDKAPERIVADVQPVAQVEPQPTNEPNLEYLKTNSDIAERCLNGVMYYNSDYTKETGALVLAVDLAGKPLPCNEGQKYQQSAKETAAQPERKANTQ